MDENGARWRALPGPTFSPPDAAMFFDSHCHLTDPAFDDDRDEVLARAREAGVVRMVAVASNPGDTLAGMELARRDTGIRTTAGVHPHEAGSATPEVLSRVRALLDEEEVVAVGECGLDFFYDNAPRDVQRRVFEAHVGFAADTGLPLVIHSRSADEDMEALIRDLPPGVTGVLHCFTGSDRLLEAALEAGLHVSFTGIVTFGSFAGAHQVRAVPTDRLMVETDSPYLAPVPWRGKRNEPAWVRHVAEAVARLRDESLDELAAHTTANALRFYGLVE